MSKSILIFDTPSRCGECPICASWQSSAFSIREYWCTASDNISVDSDDKPRWCPLKELPEERLVWFDDSDYERGYNDCLRCIVDKEDEN